MAFARVCLFFLCYRLCCVYWCRVCSADSFLACACSRPLPCCFGILGFPFSLHSELSLRLHNHCSSSLPLLPEPTLVSFIAQLLSISAYANIRVTRVVRASEKTQHLPLLFFSLLLLVLFSVCSFFLLLLRLTSIRFHSLVSCHQVFFCLLPLWTLLFHFLLFLLGSLFHWISIHPHGS